MERWSGQETVCFQASSPLNKFTTDAFQDVLSQPSLGPHEQAPSEPGLTPPLCRERILAQWPLLNWAWLLTLFLQDALLLGQSCLWAPTAAWLNGRCAWRREGKPQTPGEEPSSPDRGSPGLSGLQHHRDGRVRFVQWGVCVIFGHRRSWAENRERMELSAGPELRSPPFLDAVPKDTGHIRERVSWSSHGTPVVSAKSALTSSLPMGSFKVQKHLDQGCCDIASNLHESESSTPNKQINAGKIS